MRIAIIGMGLIGTSVALAARRAWPNLDVVEIDRNGPIEAAIGAETIVLAAPVDANIGILREHAHRFASSAITDVGSTKRATMAAARATGVTTFVGGHPIAGGATSGPADARADLFDGKRWFLLPAGADAQTVTRVRALVEALGARPVLLHDDGSGHDRVMAAVSHLPQVVASSLMAVAGEAATGNTLAWAGNGLYDTTRLASSSAEAWASILATNSDCLRPLLLSMADELRALADGLDDPDTIRTLFERAAVQRNRLVDARREP